ncbi:MAG: SDR family oxidoreductase [Saprospiraceae bacterium]|nr:SDR family oxidoreductase [Lewinella sp.]
MQNKICVITGANAGLGFETAKALAEKQAEVIMICRSREKGELARQKIVDETGNEKTHLLLADLSSQRSVKDAADEINQRWKKVNVLVNNAATVRSKPILTEDGVETQFAVNHLSYFLLTHALMDSLRAGKEARVVNVSSGNHTKGEIHFDDLNLIQEYHVLKAYNQTKLANVLFTYELDRRLRQSGIQHVHAHCINPGLNKTRIGEKATNPLHALAWRLRAYMGMSPAEGAKCQVYVASAPELEGVSGKYWYKSVPVSSVAQSYDEALASRLWQVSESLCSIADYFAPGN